MVTILFNYDGNIAEVQEEFNIQFAEISEMIQGSFMCCLDNADDFDVIDLFMANKGKCEVISGFTKDGKQYDAKLDKNKYGQTKYKKYLKDKYVLDEFGEPTNVKLPKYLWQVNKYMGWNDREL